MVSAEIPFQGLPLNRDMLGPAIRYTHFPELVVDCDTVQSDSLLFVILCEKSSPLLYNWKKKVTP